MYADLTIVALFVLVYSAIAGGVERTLFIGWFGPRGLASIVFGIMVLAADLPGGGTLAVTVVFTILLLFGLALNDEFGIVLGEIAIEAALVGALAVGVWSMRGEHRLHTTRLSLLVAVLLLFAVRLWVAHAGLDLIWLGVVIVYLILTTWSAMRMVLFSSPVDWNKIIGSFCVFMLMGSALSNRRK